MYASCVAQREAQPHGWTHVVCWALMFCFVCVTDVLFYRDVLYSLVTAVEMPLPRAPAPSRAKRPHDADAEAASALTFSGAIATIEPPAKRLVAGSSRASASSSGFASLSDAGGSGVGNGGTFGILPTRTSDLGYMAMNDPMRNLDGSILDGFATLSTPTSGIPNFSSLDDPFQFGSQLPFAFGAGLELPLNSTPGFRSSPGSGSQSSQLDSFEAMLQGLEGGAADSAGVWSTAQLAQPSYVVTLCSSWAC
jgi:hypothetical protein